MLGITLIDGQYFQWWVGQSHPFNDPSDYRTHLISSIRADGDELAYIETRCHDIPRASRTKIVRWYGDHAKFIVGNLTDKTSKD